MIQVFLPKITEESQRAVVDVLKSGWIGLGPKTSEFEKKFAGYLGVEHAVGMNSATSALHVAMELAGVGSVDRVITTANTFVSTNHVIKYVGADPVFCDIEENTGNIDVDEVERLVEKGAEAIVCVHFGGYPCDMDRLTKIAEEYGVVLIEDCAHACGAEYKGVKVGNFGDFACFSFQAVKNLPVGDGGMLVCKDMEHKAEARKLRWLGIDKSTFDRTDMESGRKKAVYSWEYNVPMIGYKYHMNDISAAIGVEQLKVLDADNQRRKEICDRYREGLKGVDGIRLMEYSDDRKSSYHFMPILVENRVGFIKSLKENDIHVGVHYARNDRYVVYKECDLPKTEYFCSREVTLPCHLLLTDEDVGFVIDTIKGGW